MTDELYNRGFKVNHKHVLRIMQENDLLAEMYNKQTRKYNSSIGPQGKKAKNKIHRRFES